MAFHIFIARREGVFMKKGIGRILKIGLSLSLAIIMLVIPPDRIEAEAAYVEGVEIAEDAYETLRKGTTKYNNVDYAVQDGYNPVYYYLNYADLRDAFGADPDKLIEHWVNFGKNEKRVCNNLVVRDARLGSSSYEYVVPTSKKTKDKKDEMIVIPGEIHSNGGMTRDQEDQARSVAKQIAQSVFDQVTAGGSANQIDMVAYATGIVKAYCDLGTFTTEGKIYRTAYGVFVGHEYSSAGATRALGLVLDYLDQLCQDANAKAREEAQSDTKGKTKKVTEYPPLKWVHVNANKWDDQWCQVVCDNHEAYADAILGQAGYGKHPNDGGKKQDVQSYSKSATESDIINTVPQYIDGQGRIYEDHQYNKVN
jgi:hypothetical protein